MLRRRLTRALGIMKLAALRLRPMRAFLSTVALVLAYLVAVLSLAHAGGSKPAHFAGAMHILLVWLPLFASATFYFWISRGAEVSRPKLVVQIAAATVLASLCNDPLKTCTGHNPHRSM